MAPEQFQGKPLPASDQNSLGIVVYEWLCGTRPFNGPLGELIRLHESATPPPMAERVPSLSPAIEKVVQKALAKDPRKRYRSVRDFAQAFQKACYADNSMRNTFTMPAILEQARPIVVTPPEDSSVIWNVPYYRNPFFTGRSHLLTLLHDTFCSGKVTTRTQALSGLGGIGKTQVALEYVYRYHNEYQVILWVRGETQEKMLSDISSFATMLKLKGQHVQEQHHLIEMVRSWLKKNTKWLLDVQHCVALIKELKIVSTEAARLLEQAGIYLQIQAQFTQAYALFEQASDVRLLLNEAEPVATVAFLSHHFWLHYYLGQYAQAEPLILTCGTL